MVPAAAAQLFATVVLPVFVLVGVGVAADRAFRLDLPTLSRVCFHVLLPALIFVKLLESTLDLGQARTLVLFSLAQLAVLLPLGYLLFARLPASRRTVMALATAFFNCGNFGIPVAELAYPGLGAGVMAVVLMTQNFVTFSVGISLVEGQRRGLGGVLLGLLRMPVLHAIVLAVALRVLRGEVPGPLRDPLRYLSDGLIPLALFTLGVQLSRSRPGRALGAIGVLAVTRLLLSPLIAWGLVRLFGLHGPVAAILIVAGGLPVAVNVYIIAAEYDLDADLASQAVFWTTALSAVTLSVLLTLNA